MQKRTQTLPIIKFSDKYNIYMKNSEDFLPYMNPEFYFYAYDLDSAEYLINMLQTKVNYLIFYLSNGNYFDLKSILFTSLNTINVSYIRDDLLFIKFLLRKIQKFEKIGKKRETKEISSIIDYTCMNKKTPIFVVLSIITKLCRLLYSYVDLFDLRDKTKTFDVNIETAENLDIHPILSSMKEYISNNLKDYIVNFYIHGSVSRKDFTNFSDLDTAIILKKDTILDAGKFLKFIKGNFYSIAYCYRFNLLHHHEHHILTECDLQYYNQFLLPAKVFEYSTPLLERNEKIRFNIRDSTFEHFNFVWNIIQFFRRCYISNFRNINNIYKFRFFVSLILLLPVLLLNTKNIYAHKKDSFKLARKYFSSEEWEAVEIASEFRRNWNYKPSLLIKLSSIVFLRLMNNYKLFKFTSKNYSDKLPVSIQEAVSNKKFYEKSIIFVEAIADDLYKSFRIKFKY